ncbi:MAG: glycosyltransferase [Salinibacterium sp.]|nr:MAG: glycosyltransferase [Salinibacterium sp.]
MKITIWTGSAWEPWGPASVEDGGIGGSETAAVHMARELARRGHEVTCFGQHTGFEGTWDGVLYRNFEAAITDSSLLDCDVFVSSRDKRALRLKPHARYKVLWVHDIHVGDDFEQELLKYDRIWCLTEWHRKTLQGYYAHVSKSKLTVIRNGIDAARFVQVEPHSTRKPHFVYSSSPDRGLNVLLDLWPQIKALRSDAELHVYYGFDTWEKMAVRNKVGQAQIAWFKERLIGERAEKAQIWYHGRVGQAELAAAFSKSPLWLYPTGFKETYCITALEAQAAGAVPISTRLAALSETVKVGTLIAPHNTEARYRTEFLDACKHFLITHPEEATKLSGEGRAWAMEQTWSKLADAWLAEFDTALAES